MPRRRQAGDDAVSAYFDSVSRYWSEVYNAPDVGGQVYRRRRDRVLAWLRALSPTRGARLLEVGAGAAGVAVVLALQGLQIDVIDTSDAMLDHVRALAAGANVAIRAEVGDVHALGSDPGTYCGVVAIGVLPWLRSPSLAIREMARVVEPGGFVLFTYDNRLRLTWLLDPWLSPPLRGVRRALRPVLAGGRPRSRINSRLEKPADVETMLAAAGLVSVRHTTSGFGPFTFAKRPLLPSPADVRLDRGLQALADRGIAPLRTMGVHGLVLARKPQGRPGMTG